MLAISTNALETKVLALDDGVYAGDIHSFRFGAERAAKTSVGVECKVACAKQWAEAAEGAMGSQFLGFSQLQRARKPTPLPLVTPPTELPDVASEASSAPQDDSFLQRQGQKRRRTSAPQDDSSSEEGAEVEDDDGKSTDSQEKHAGSATVMLAAAAAKMQPSRLQSRGLSRGAFLPRGTFDGRP